MDKASGENTATVITDPKTGSGANESQPEWYKKMLETAGVSKHLSRLFEIEETVAGINVQLTGLKTGTPAKVALFARRGELDRESAAHLVELWRLGLIEPIEFT